VTSSQGGRGLRQKHDDCRINVVGEEGRGDQVIPPAVSNCETPKFNFTGGGDLERILKKGLVGLTEEPSNVLFPLLGKPNS